MNNDNDDGEDDNDSDDDSNDNFERCLSEFFLIALLHLELSPACTLKWPGCICVRILCHMEQRDSSATKFDKVEIRFIFDFCQWLEPLTNEGGEKDRNAPPPPQKKKKKKRQGASENAIC